MILGVILLLLGLTTIGVALILLVINFFQKKPKAKILYTILAGFIVVIASFIVLIVTVDTTTVDNTESVASDTEKAENKNDNEEKIKEEAEKQALAKAAAEQKAEDEAKAAAEQKAKEEAEAKAKAEEEAKKQQEQLAANMALEAVTVSRVVDGDTVELSDGRKVRLIGVNTPESTNKHEEYGKEASNYTTTKLEGKQVWIQKDVSETDRYQRYLRIIWLSIPTDDMNESEIRSKMFNADLVINGYAEPSTYPPDVKYSEYFVKFAREARDSKMGLWAFGVNGTTKGDLDPKETATKPKTSTTNPVPSTPPATTTPPASTGGSESYKNCTELRKVYPEGVPSTHPAYAPKHDRDKDNWACEKSA
ncbi:thermonuclease family protein [Bacillus sp. JJ1521]|uniref:thermonuclease family protein n=1 Tax=Bacillus sp. JJ1521 TaxID=3122957 RepID=UPI002FFE99D4